MSHPSSRRSIVAVLLSIVCLTSSAFAGSSISVTFDAKLRAEPATGRLIVYLLHAELGGRRQRDPADGFVEQNPQPMYGIDVKDLKPGTPAIVDDSATAFPVKFSELPPGKYRAQAVLDLHHADSDWSREPGNLSSQPVAFEIVAGKPTELKIELSDEVKDDGFPQMKGVEFIRIRSKLLSDFRKQETYLRAGIVMPIDYDPQKKYAAVYEIPGFGGNHLDAADMIGRDGKVRGVEAMQKLMHNAFWIMLDPESPNGHTLFADSDNNGPCGQALIDELIPALEAKYSLIADPSARLLRGHSSGGWSSLWLALTYPKTFSATWSSSPDPVDFRKFELVNIYDWQNMYTGPDGKDLPSARFGGKETMTVRQENGMEQVLGPGNSQAQQWDSWMAVFGHRNADGSIKDLYDPITGKLDHAEAKSYERYDIRHLVATNPAKYLPLFHDSVHILVGDMDTYYLNEAVMLLKDEVDKQLKLKEIEPGDGYIHLIKGVDHSSIYMTQAMRDIPAEMLEHLTKAGHVK